jgi:biopolymer transport protein TolQ
LLGLAQTGVSGSLVGLVTRQGPFALFILGVLLFFLASALGILVERFLYIKRARRESERFRAAFRKAERFSDVKTLSDELSASPLVGLFLAGYTELTYQLKASGASGGSDVGAPVQTAAPNIDAISRALQRASSLEVAKLERTVSFLATTASVAPFIGLLGTVYGIMNAFRDIAIRGSAGIATVAPGISEALVATAAGLAAAIPAVIGYNYLINQIKSLASEMDDFALEFVSIAERQFSEPPRP